MPKRRGLSPTGARSMNTGAPTNRAQRGLSGTAPNGQSFRRQGNETMGEYGARTGTMFGGRVTSVNGKSKS